MYMNASGGKRPSGPCVKAVNLALGISTAVLKEALSRWGVEGIKEVVLSEGRFGPIALFLFKSGEQAELMMMAQGVEVEGRPLMLEYMSAAPPAMRIPERRAPVASRELPPSTKLVKATGLPKEIMEEDLVTHLRSHGVLGIAKVVLQRGQEGTVWFNEVENVKSAISKANNTIFREKTLTLQAIHEEWGQMLPDHEPREWTGGSNMHASPHNGRSSRGQGSEYSEDGRGRHAGARDGVAQGGKGFNGGKDGSNAWRNGEQQPAGGRYPRASSSGAPLPAPHDPNGYYRGGEASSSNSGRREAPSGDGGWNKGGSSNGGQGRE
ncbi:unnamed protein product, partial [Polarella glacialis]